MDKIDFLILIMNSNKILTKFSSKKGIIIHHMLLNNHIVHNKIRVSNQWNKSIFENNRKGFPLFCRKLIIRESSPFLIRLLIRWILLISIIRVCKIGYPILLLLSRFAGNFKLSISKGKRLFVFLVVDSFIFIFIFESEFIILCQRKKHWF